MILVISRQKSQSTSRFLRQRSLSAFEQARRLHLLHQADHVQRRKPWKEVAAELGWHLCSRTLKAAFEKERYFRRVATEKPLLTDKHRYDRLVWAYKHVEWEDQDWLRVGWSDEMSARLGGGKIFVTRMAEERLDQDCLIPRFRRYSCCMVWGIISGLFKGPLILFEKDWCVNKKKTVTSHVYIKHILPYIKEFQREMAAYFNKEMIFMEDNCSIHNSKETKAAQRLLQIIKMTWPANSPDLNPIENVWQMLKHRVAQRYPKTTEEVKLYLEEEWEKITVEDYKKYILSMRERCVAVIQAEGLHTKW